MSDTLKKYARPDMKISELLQAHPTAYVALLECGMGCVSCPSAMVETIEEACMVHGLDVEDVVDYVNHSLAAADEKKTDDVAGDGPAVSENIGSADAEDAGVSGGEASENDEMTAKMMDFLDARSYEERLRIFDEMRDADDKILNNIAVSMDITLDDSDDDYERIATELRFRSRFEASARRLG